MPEGGILTVSLQEVEAAENSWEISVSDTGNTLTLQQALRIFEPFQNQSHVGTGLALAIVYQIVQAHDGRITAGPCDGGGTCFRLLLHREEASLGLSKGEKAAEPTASGSIVVDLSRSASAGSGGSNSDEGGARG
jgi:K+-sensing histidine kinase KdpD